MMETKSIKRAITGPIAQKFIRSTADHYSKKKIINIDAWKSAKVYHQKLKQFHTEKDLSHLDPLYAVYIDMQHHIADFIEIFSNLPESYELNDSFEKAEEMYMPSWPPMSPITNSYFTCWSAFDMSVGIKQETYATVMIDFCKSINTHSNFVHVLENMQHSRMGLYIVDGDDKKFVYLRELYTNKIIKTHVPSQYFGVPGEIWLVRLLPDPTAGYGNFSVALTTPYVIINFPLGKSMPANFSELIYLEDEWIQFIERNIAKIKNKDKQQAYNHFMKYGLTKMYWPEYIFLSYVNHTPNMIWLTGFPDRPESLPHADNNHDKYLF